MAGSTMGCWPRGCPRKLASLAWALLFCRGLAGADGCALPEQDLHQDLTAHRPTSLFVYLACVLAVIFWLSARPSLRRLFLVTPAVLYVYFLPTVGTSLGVSPASLPGL